MLLPIAAGNARVAGARWLKINFVGIIGLGLQLSLLQLLINFGGVNYLAATALAVELTVLHNYCWHACWTWRERGGHHQSHGHPSHRLRWQRLLRFNATNGLISIVGNLLLMKLLAGNLHLPPQWANLIAVGICSLANFFISDGFVFRDSNDLFKSQSDDME
jgi:putative flippase GtrA